MNSILQALVVNENAVFGRGIDHTLSGKRHVVNTAPNGELKKVMRRARNVGLFFASPFIALAYIVAMPIVGLFMFARLAMEARANSR